MAGLPETLYHTPSCHTSHKALLTYCITHIHNALHNTLCRHPYYTCTRHTIQNATTHAIHAIHCTRDVTVTSPVGAMHRLAKDPPPSHICYNRWWLTRAHVRSHANWAHRVHYRSQPSGSTTAKLDYPRLSQLHSA